MNQNYTELSINNSKDEQSANRSVNITRSKTGNCKSTFKVTMDVISDMTQAQFEHQHQHYQQQQFIDVNLLSDTNLSNHCNEYDHSLLSVHTINHQQCSKNSPLSTSPSSTTNVPLTTSKSENNIFEKNLSANPAQFNVVSLSDLSVGSTDDNGVHPWNDLSKTQVLNCLSDEKVDGKF